MEFSANERLILGTICRYFHSRGEWPTYDYLDRTLSDDHEDVDVEAVGRELEPFMYDGRPYALMAGWDPERRTTLSVTALHTCLTDGMCPEIAEDLDAFATVLRLFVEKYRTRDPGNPRSAEVTSDELRDRFGMSDLTLRKLFDLVSRSGLTAGSSYREASADQPAWWTVTVSPEMRKYRRAMTVEDFIRLRKQARDEERRRYLTSTVSGMPGTTLLTDFTEPADAFGQTPAADSAGAVTGVQIRPISLFPTGPFSRNDRLCFVLMPFAEDLRAVYNGAIVPAATDAELECQRADEIMRPGGIMAQVWQALVEARVVVADLTNMNPNVFYELGLAHTIGHDVILLTQDRKWVPFDLQHMRWFKYQLDEHGLHLLKQNLSRAFKEVLKETAQNGQQAWPAPMAPRRSPRMPAVSYT